MRITERLNRFRNLGKRAARGASEEDDEEADATDSTTDSGTARSLLSFDEEETDNDVEADSNLSDGADDEEDDDNATTNPSRPKKPVVTDYAQFQKMLRAAVRASLVPANE